MPSHRDSHTSFGCCICRVRTTAIYLHGRRLWMFVFVGFLHMSDMWFWCYCPFLNDELGVSRLLYYDPAHILLGLLTGNIGICFPGHCMNFISMHDKLISLKRLLDSHRWLQGRPPIDNAWKTWHNSVHYMKILVLGKSYYNLAMRRKYRSCMEEVITGNDFRSRLLECQ